jgi:hypothetical protein
MLPFHGRRVFFCFGVAYVNRSLIGVGEPVPWGEPGRAGAEPRECSPLLSAAIHACTDTLYVCIQTSTAHDPCAIIYAVAVPLHSFQFGLEHMKLMMTLIITRTFFNSKPFAH